MLREYQCRSSVEFSSCSHTSTPMSTRETINSEEEDGMAQLVEFLNTSSASVQLKSELDHYLEEPVLLWTQEFDILSWWKVNGVKYPTLQLIARHFLAIPVSTVAFESAFSTGGRVVSLHRSRLHPDTLEALMCSQYWLWSETEGTGSSDCTTSSSMMRISSLEEEDVEIKYCHVWTACRCHLQWGFCVVYFFHVVVLYWIIKLLVRTWKYLFGC